jgi:hypothetical protein
VGEGEGGREGRRAVQTRRLARESSTCHDVEREEEERGRANVPHDWAASVPTTDFNSWG